MDFIPIFVLESPVEQHLLAVPVGPDWNEFELFFIRMSDPELVRSFCTKNWKFISMTVSGTIEEVANDICDLAAGMEERFYLCRKDPRRRLDDLFKVTGNRGTGDEAVQTCISISEAIKSSLPYPELYALRPAPNYYLVTGGRICLPGGPDEDEAIQEVEKKWMDIYRSLI